MNRSWEIYRDLKDTLGIPNPPIDKADLEKWLSITEEALDQVRLEKAKHRGRVMGLDEIIEIGIIQDTREASLGMSVRKSGRTTSFTTGQINLINATVNVTYGGGRTARFEDQLVSGPMSQGGDSGSLLVSGDSQHAVGLLFAGSDQSTIFSPIQAVLDCLEVSI